MMNMAFEEDTPKLFDSFEEERNGRRAIFAISSLLLNIGLFTLWGVSGNALGAGLLGLYMLTRSRDQYWERWNIDPTTGKPKS
jgi:hypothetical protein